MPDTQTVTIKPAKGRPNLQNRQEQEMVKREIEVKPDFGSLLEDSPIEAN
jgi:hypothetical protein